MVKDTVPGQRLADTLPAPTFPTPPHKEGSGFTTVLLENRLSHSRATSPAGSLHPKKPQALWEERDGGQPPAVMLKDLTFYFLSFVWMAWLLFSKICQMSAHPGNDSLIWPPTKPLLRTVHKQNRPYVLTTLTQCHKGHSQPEPRPV